MKEDLDGFIKKYEELELEKEKMSNDLGEYRMMI